MDHQDAVIGDLREHGMLPAPEHRFHPPTELHWRHRLMARLMVRGSSDAGILAFIRRERREKVDGETVIRAEPPPAPGEPLPVDEACMLAGVRRRYARELVDTAIFRAVLREEGAAPNSTPHIGVDA